MSRRTLLIFSQTFIPDPASVGQHMADVAIEMARRGHRVRVYTANRSYEDAGTKYPSREHRQGVDIRRLPFSSFGKKTLLIRAFGTATFMAQCIFIALFTPRLSGIFFSTSPPLIGFVAACAKFIRRVPIAYWAMDLNPDQLIAMGKIKPTSPTAWVLEHVNRFILNHSDLVIALDRFMAERLQQRCQLGDRLLVMPPWPHEQSPEAIDQAANPFRLKHGLNGKFVIMFSGNHSPANPLATLLQAAIELREQDELRFLFVGGGLLKRDIEAAIAEHRLKNVISLPYQPLVDLKYSLSAADVHVVSMGRNMVGIIHPCKIYGAMAVARPILYLGPSPSHIADILNDHHLGWQVAHGDVPGMLRTLDIIRRTPASHLAEMGAAARSMLQAQLSQEILCGRFCDRLSAILLK